MDDKTGMINNKYDPHILVVKLDTGIADPVLRFTGTSVKLVETSNEADALESIRTTRPDIVIITGSNNIAGYTGFYHEIGMDGYQGIARFC